MICTGPFVLLLCLKNGADFKSCLSKYDCEIHDLLVLHNIVKTIAIHMRLKTDNSALSRRRCLRTMTPDPTSV